MFTVYILFSAKKDSYYIGFTSDIIEERIRKHNSNHNGFTGNTGDWKLVYSEIYVEKSTAMKREKEIKKWKSRKMIERLLAG
jgi:putative endonuclease